MKLVLKKIGISFSILIIFNFLTPNCQIIGINSYEGNTQTVKNPIYNKPCIAADSKEVLKSNYIFKADTSSEIGRYKIKYHTQMNEKNRKIFDFKSDGNYSEVKGVTCFRGNNERSGGSFGTADVNEKKLRIVWEKNIGSIDSWTGVGWNGQPSIVMWDDKIKNIMNIKNEKKKKNNLTEVIYAALDGKIYFIDIDDGKETREPVTVGAPIKGSVTIDPRGYPLLYAGQGIDRNRGKIVNFAYRIFSLIDCTKLYEINGNDSFAKRSWGAFDSTALIDRTNDSLLICGENGILYSGKLNTKYENGKISISPQIDKYNYESSLTRRRGIENSIAAFGKYGFFADNDGVLQCIDLEKLEPVWVQNVNDDTDSTVVMEENQSGLSLYTACEVDCQGRNGVSYVRKIDGQSGRIVWQNAYKCAYDENVNGGALSTPICGKWEINNIVIFNIARTPEYSKGLLIALDKMTGREKWRILLDDYCWSSPLAIYSAEGKSYIVQCDSKGKTMLIDGINGNILDTIYLGANVEGTPACFNNMIVVGTRGQKIIGFKIY